ncbi:hypothetical protein HMPREF9711_01869 [Myroides odoratimimus CCUG 3837]|uniref:hypothetical protein n=1 Tax=Myroides odoratimimus TaxID=76832 RepID=UPI000280AA55|nr:hypothetical protein [Myroides odoratimimus]EKB04540.1 hypothetical protein HMPREF9711_01869 [Myroides odoratimimus CCUG 3837]
MNKKKLYLIVSSVAILLALIVGVVCLWEKSEDNVKQKAVEEMLPQEEIEEGESDYIKGVLSEIDTSIDINSMSDTLLKIYSVPYDLNEDNKAVDLELLQFFVKKGDKMYNTTFDLYIVLWNKTEKRLIAKSTVDSFRVENDAMIIEGDSIVFNKPYVISDSAKLSFYVLFETRTGNNWEGGYDNQYLFFSMEQNQLKNLGHLSGEWLRYDSTYGSSCESSREYFEENEEVIFTKNKNANYSDITFKSTVKIVSSYLRPLKEETRVKNYFKELNSTYVFYYMKENEDYGEDCVESENTKEVKIKYQYDKSAGRYNVVYEGNADTEEPLYEKELKKLLGVTDLPLDCSELEVVSEGIFGRSTEVLIRTDNSPQPNKRVFFMVIDSRTEKLLKYYVVDDMIEVKKDWHLDRFVFNPFKTFDVFGHKVYEMRTIYTKNSLVFVSSNLLCFNGDKAEVLLKDYNIGGLTEQGSNSYSYKYDVTLNKISENASGQLEAEYSYKKATLESSSDVLERTKYKNVQEGLKQIVPLNPVSHE